MLTLQNILDSDSISTLVAKLNANFQTLSQSNGGPQGVRGEQGIPGLPGKQGPLGPIGPIGPMGATNGIIPFSALLQANDLTAPGGLSPITQPAESYDFLTTFAGGTWSPSATPQPGELWFDNNQLGWWKYIVTPDPAALDPEVLAGDVIPTYDGTYDPMGFQPGWYFYPLNLSSIISATQGVWSADKTNYLGRVSTQYSSPATLANAITQDDFGIPNARMNSKFGTVWISSGDSDPAPPPAGPGGDSTDNDTSLTFYWDYIQNTRLNAGIDRTLFKMSIDGVPYYDMMKARGYRYNDSPAPIIGFPYQVNLGADNVPLGPGGPLASQSGFNPDFFVQPLYPLTIDAYTPVLFLTNRNDFAQNTADTGSLGYYQYSPANGGDGVVRIHNFSTRNANEFFEDPTLESSTNNGEVVWDARKFITTNQFINLVPQDTAGFRSVNITPTQTEISQFNPGIVFHITEQNSAHTQAYKVFQGYHSVINEHASVRNAVGGNQSQYLGWDQLLFENRNSWYGTSIYDALPDPENATDINELVRLSGTMVRGKNGNWTAGDGEDYGSKTEGLTFFTANYTTINGYTGPGSFGYTTPATVLDNAALSLPVAYMSPARNMGVGTVANDKDGIFEPIARFQSHGDWRPYDESYNSITNFFEGPLNSGSYSAPKTWFSYSDKASHYRIKSGAFTVDRLNPGAIYNSDEGGAFSETRFATSPGSFPLFDSGLFNDILIGTIDSPITEIYEAPFPINVVKPSSAIRYESFNFIPRSPRPIVDHGNPLRSGGWGFRGAMRFGSTPRWLNKPASSTVPDGHEIGSDPNFQNIEFQLSLSPLSYSNTVGKLAENESITGVGIHNLYPRTRLHIYGKNLYGEFRAEEPHIGGLVEPSVTGNGAYTRTTWSAAPSDKQITIDKIEDTYTYAAALYDYSYDYVVNASFTPYTPYTQWSANASNYPINEIKLNGATLSTFNSTLNTSTLSATAPFLQGTGSVHGGPQNGRWSINKYVGFNLFRDLLGKGDFKGEQVTGTDYINLTQAVDRYASVWRLGTEGTSKDGVSIHDGGSAMLSDSEGKIGFAFIKSGRDGGANYGQWEQVGIGTREIVNNIKIVFDENGNIGIGNAPGYDANAYPSQKYFRSNIVPGGVVPPYSLRYLPNANGSGDIPTSVGPRPYSALGTNWTPTRSDRYGLGSSTAYGPYAPAAVNSLATEAEYIRFEIAGEKAQGRPGHHPEKRGYGYPGWKMNVFGVPTGIGAIITIQDNATATFARRYFGTPTGAVTPGEWANATYQIVTDNLGRIITFGILSDTGFSYPGYVNLLDLPEFANMILPHPADFGENGPLSPAGFVSGSFSWTAGMTISIVIDSTAVTLSGAGSKVWIPTSAVAAEPGNLYNVDGNIFVGFKYEPLQSSVVRLNNFILGDGYEFIRGSGDSKSTANTTGSPGFDATTTTTQAIFAQRRLSPKFLLTFGAIDYDSMVAAGLTTPQQGVLVNQGLAPLMKVTTVIESAQNDTSVRTYTIPKADNTGGSFMVVTDHMGQREQDAPGLAPLPQNNLKQRIRLEKVVAHEVVRTGDLQSNQSTTNGFQIAQFGMIGGWQVWPTGYEMLPIHYVKGYGLSASLRCEQVLVDPVEPVGRKLGSNIRRDLDAYWAVDNTTWSSDLQNRAGVTETFEKSEIRYRRLNENYVMFDFNIDLEALLYTNVFVDTAAPIVQPNLGNLNGYFGENFGSPAPALNGFTHSPYSPGHLLNAVSVGETSRPYKLWAGVDARWVQYVRFIYDAQTDVVGTADDCFFWEYQYGGGPTFGNWNEYRAWNAGTATVGPKITSVLQAAMMTPNYRNEQGVVNHSYNASDGPNANYQFDDTAPFTGYGWTPPTDGSPYSPWSLAVDGTSTTQTLEVTRYWNGRLNDWFHSRWDQTNSQPGLVGLGGNYPSQLGTYDGKLGDKYLDTYPYDFAYPGYTVLFQEGDWPNNETTGSIGAAPLFQYPGPTINPLSPDARANQSYINQYAYKTLWKWLQPLGIVGNTGGLAPSYIYVEHTKMFDNIVNRTFGDDAWTRNGNMQWKVTPIADGNGKYEYLDSDGTDYGYQETGTNTSFAIEVMFDKPIFVSGRSLVLPPSATNLAAGSIDLIVNSANAPEYWEHIRTQLKFAGINFDDIYAGLSYNKDVKLYSNLTLRGQSVVKYKQTQRNKISTTPDA